MGYFSNAAGDAATAVGAESAANGSIAAAVGFRADASGDFSTAVGGLAQATAFNATAIGNSALASGSSSLALGGDAVASGARSVALGAGSQALEANVVSVGGGAGGNAPATRRIVNVAEGRLTADSTDAVTGSQLTVTNQRVGAVETRVSDIDSRIGSMETTSANTLAYDDSDRGRLTLSGERGTTIDNLAGGSIASGSRQAVNGDQLFQSLSNAASILGGGASVGLQGMFVAPNYVIQGTTYNNVGDALGALDARVSSLGQSLASGAPISSTPAPAAGGGSGPATANAGNLPATTPAVDASPAAVVGQGAVASGAGATAIGLGATASADNSVALGQDSVADRANTVSVGSVGNERQVTNVAAGTQATDAVNKGQLDSGVASANSYTDTRFSTLSDSFDVFKGEVDGRLRHMDRRIDRQGAMSSAMLNMATSAAGIRTQNRVGVGVGFQGGESALSLGYQRAISGRATVTFGGAFSGDDSSVGVGAGFGW